MPRARATDSSRIDIPYFDGLNSATSPTLTKKTELSHMENARAPVIGVLEKREGQVKIGTSTLGDVFYTTANYGLMPLKITDETYQGIIRVSDTTTFSNTKTISVFEDVAVYDYQGVVEANTIKLLSIENITVGEGDMIGKTDNDTLILDGTSTASTIYSLNSSNQWGALSDARASNLIGNKFDSTKVDGDLLMVNGKDYNRFLKNDGVTVTASDEAGSLYNSPRAKKTAFYKNRIYLANFTRDGTRYPTTVIRSSYPSGIISLVNGDQDDHATATALDVTDTKYFYSDTGMNTYEVRRGGTLISTITVTTVNETSITITHSGTPDFKSSDEIWISGTYDGEKQYRWANNPTAVGKDVKQYDTFKIAGGNDDEITLFEPIGNVLLMANSNTMVTWNDYNIQNYDLGIGCPSFNGYTKLLGTLYFVHYSGIFSTTGDIPTRTSRKVDRYISGATRSGIENAAAGYKGLSVFFAIGNVTLYNEDGSTWKTLSDVCLEYNVQDQNWYVHTNVPAEQFMTFLSTVNGEQLLISHGKNGKSIKEFLEGFVDDDEEIFFRVDTNNFQLVEQFEYYASPLYILARIDRGSLMNTLVSLDNTDFYQLPGANEKGVSKLKVVQSPNVTSTGLEEHVPICNRIKVSFADSSRQRCRISQMAIAFLPSPKDEPK